MTMIPYQPYLDDIQSAVADPLSADPDLLRDAAAMYAEACAEVNDRLRKIGKLLDRGLRSEALQMADQEPPLLDVIAALDLPELDAWKSLLAQMGMVAPPDLRLDLATELNRAYAEQQPLAALLRNHRLLALAKAPLAARIGTLRKLAAADAGNLAWDADLQTYEKTRLQQIERDLDQALRAKDGAALHALRGELEEPGWTIAIPATLRERVAAAHRQSAADVARRELAQLDAQLNDAHMGFDVDHARELRQRWHQLWPIAGLLPNDPLAQRTAPVWEWLAQLDLQAQQQEQIDRVTAALQQAVDEGDDLDEIRRLRDQLVSWDAPPESLLQRRIDERIDAEDLRRRRRQRLIVASVASSLAAVAVGVGWWLRAQSQARAVEQAVTTLSDLAATQRGEEAARYYEELSVVDPRSALHPSVMEIKGEVDQLLATERQRQVEFDQALTALESGDRADADDRLLQRARELLKSDAADELERLSVVEREVAAARRERQAQHDSSLTSALQQLRTKLDVLARDTAPGAEDKLQKLLAELREVDRNFAQATPALRQQVAPLVRRTESLVQLARERERETAAVARITQAVGDAAEFDRLLGEFAQNYAKSAVATAQPRRSELAQLRDGLLAWNALYAELQTGTPLGPDQAQRFVDAGQQLAQQHPELPHAADFQRRLAYLQSIAARRGADGASPLAEVDKLLRDRLMANLYLIEDQRGFRYYLPQQPEEKDASLLFTHLVGFELTPKTTSLPLSQVVRKQPAPQSLFVNDARAWLAKLDDGNWEAVFCKLVERAADRTQQPAMDPLMQIVVLRKLLEAGSAGSAAFREGMAPYAQVLADQTIDMSVEWMSPGDKMAEETRPQAEFALDQLASLQQECIAQVAAKWKSYREPPPQRYAWVGWLDQQDNGAWVCRCNGAATEASLCVVAKAPGAPTATVLEVGRWRDEVSPVGQLPEIYRVAGTAVFAQLPGGRSDGLR